VVHAHPQALVLLKRHAPYPRGGIVHAFGGSAAVAAEYHALGFLLSIGGSVTREGFQKLKKAVISLPLEKLAVETDSPDQTPRLPGVAPEELNQPANLIGIAEAIGRLRNESAERILSASAENLRKLLGIAKS
jgi:TatD DNase family protein